jgi:D-alanine--poly(phosphoribitol) ligase subunit 1
MHDDARGVPIGYPVEGTKLRLDAENDGELLILGDQVGPGYFERPDLTSQRFFTDPQTGLRGYRTGDLCTEENGLYYYRGRRDNQLKLHGHRIEIEDIESNLARVENIAQAAVIPVWEDGRVQYLAAFLLLERDDGLTSLTRAIGIKKQAAEFIPAYMIPRKLIVLDDFPLNTNGKVDKKELANRL